MNIARGVIHLSACSISKCRKTIYIGERKSVATKAVDEKNQGNTVLDSCGQINSSYRSVSINNSRVSVEYILRCEELVGMGCLIVLALAEHIMWSDASIVRGRPNLTYRACYSRRRAIHTADVRGVKRNNNAPKASSSPRHEMPIILSIETVILSFLHALLIVFLFIISSGLGGHGWLLRTRFHFTIIQKLKASFLHAHLFLSSGLHKNAANKSLFYSMQAVNILLPTGKSNSPRFANSGANITGAYSYGARVSGRWSSRIGFRIISSKCAAFNNSFSLYTAFI